MQTRQVECSFLSEINKTSQFFFMSFIKDQITGKSES